MPPRFRAIALAAFSALTELVPLAGCAQAEAHPVFIETPATLGILEYLHSGGFVFYMRHGNTDNSMLDRGPKADLDDCSMQRILDAHPPSMAELNGHYVKPEGTAVVIRPFGQGTFEHVASIHSAMWPELLK